MAEQGEKDRDRERDRDRTAGRSRGYLVVREYRGEMPFGEALSGIVEACREAWLDAAGEGAQEGDR